MSKPAILAISMSQTFRKEIALPECNILPSILALLAQIVVSRLKLHNLKLVLESSNLPRSEFTQIAGESYETTITLRVCEDTRLEGISSLLVDKVANLHLAFHPCKSKKRPRITNTNVVSCHGINQAL